MPCYSAIRRWAYLNTIFWVEKVDLWPVIYGTSICRSWDIWVNLVQHFQNACQSHQTWKISSNIMKCIKFKCFIIRIFLLLKKISYFITLLIYEKDSNTIEWVTGIALPLYQIVKQTRGPRGPWVAHLRKRSKVTV